jgi:acyl-coenzyme A thioesterase PaaI-like protein
MDYEQIREMLDSVSPFFNYVGVRYESVGESEAVTSLPEAQGLKNHIGSQHAGALFTLVEAAAGGAFVGAMAEHMAAILFVAKGGEISYKKVARGPIRAVAHFPETAAAVIERLGVEDRLEVRIGVDAYDAQEVKVVEASFLYHVRPGAPTVGPDRQDMAVDATASSL